MKAVIVDYDGIIVDSTNGNEQRSRRVAEIFKEEWSREFMEVWRNLYLHLTEGKITLGEYYNKIAALIEKKVSGTEDNEYMKGEKLRDKDLPRHLIEIKRAQGAKVKFAILGNYPGRWAEHLLNHHNLSRHFSAIVMSDRIKSRMPDQASYEEVLGKLGVHPRDCIFVSHSPAHLQGAKDAAMTALYLGDIDSHAESFTVIPNILEVQKYL